MAFLSRITDGLRSAGSPAASPPGFQPLAVVPSYMPAAEFIEIFKLEEAGISDMETAKKYLRAVISLIESARRANQPGSEWHKIKTDTELALAAVKDSLQITAKLDTQTKRALEAWDADEAIIYTFYHKLMPVLKRLLPNESEQHRGERLQAHLKKVNREIYDKIAAEVAAEMARRLPRGRVRPTIEQALANLERAEAEIKHHIDDGHNKISSMGGGLLSRAAGSASSAEGDFKQALDRIEEAERDLRVIEDLAGRVIASMQAEFASRRTIQDNIDWLVETGSLTPEVITKIKTKIKYR